MSRSDLRVAILHPGLMGETLAANCSAETLWLSAGRCADTRDRAEQHGMAEVASMNELVEQADVASRSVRQPKETATATTNA